MGYLRCNISKPKSNREAINHFLLKSKPVYLSIVLHLFMYATMTQLKYVSTKLEGKKSNNWLSAHQVLQQAQHKRGHLIVCNIDEWIARTNFLQKANSDHSLQSKYAFIEGFLFLFHRNDEMRHDIAGTCKLKQYSCVDM